MWSVRLSLLNYCVRKVDKSYPDSLTCTCEWILWKTSSSSTSISSFTLAPYPAEPTFYSYKFVFKILKKGKANGERGQIVDAMGPKEKINPDYVPVFYWSSQLCLPRFWKADEKFYVVFAGFCASKWNGHETHRPHIRLSHLEGKAMAPRVSPVCNSLPLRLTSKDKGKKC